jgi:DNA-binding transcriptional LysR family regulator
LHVWRVLLHVMQQKLADFDALRSFVAVAECLSFHEAAAMLRISAPALTRRIQKLEAALDTTLLERSTRLVVPTPEGRVLLPLAREAIAAVDHAIEAVRKAARTRSGDITVACIPTMTLQVLPHIIRAFQARSPNTPVRVIECGADAVLHAVRGGEADFALGFPLIGASIGELAFERLFFDPYCLILQPGHELAERESVRWHDLKPHKVITAGRLSGNMKVLSQALRGLDWQPVTVYEIDHLTTSLGLVEAGLGIAVIPRSALPARLPPAMTVRRLENPDVARSIGLFRRRNWTMPAVARQFLATAKHAATTLRDPQPVEPATDIVAAEPG